MRPRRTSIHVGWFCPVCGDEHLARYKVLTSSPRAKTFVVQVKGPTKLCDHTRVWSPALQEIMKKRS